MALFFAWRSPGKLFVLLFFSLEGRAPQSGLFGF